jgi:VIT1/CCC1 family predicted Fe2+/Mn2+ transporter
MGMADQGEKHFSHRIGLLRAMVLGANDGIISTACLILGVAASDASGHTILVAGTAGLVAGAASMAIGEYVSVSSQRDSEQADIKKEIWELENTPERELAELTGIYQSKGLSPDLAREVAIELTKHDALKTHLAEELGISAHNIARPVQAAISSAVAFSVGAGIPLLASSLANDANRIWLTIVVVFVALLGLGASSASFGGAQPTRPVLRIMIGGGVAMAFTMAIGSLFGATVG